MLDCTDMGCISWIWTIVRVDPCTKRARGSGEKDGQEKIRWPTPENTNKRVDCCSTVRKDERGSGSAFENGRDRELGVTEPGRKRNWVEGRKGKVDQDSFLKLR